MDRHKISHGVWQTVLCTWDTDLDNLGSSAISGDELLNEIHAIPAKKILLIVDACHAGGTNIKGANYFLKRSGLPNSYYEILSSGEGRVLIASSKQHQYSYLKDKYSLFTYHLLNGLKGKASIRGDCLVHVLDLFDYVNEAVKGDEPKQEPILKANNVDQNFPVAISNITISNKTNAKTLTLSNIREEIINAPSLGAQSLSNYISKNHLFLAKQNEIDMLRSELSTITNETNIFGWDDNAKVTKRRIIFRLLKICSDLELQ